MQPWRVVCDHQGADETQAYIQHEKRAYYVTGSIGMVKDRIQRDNPATQAIQ